MSKSVDYNELFSKLQKNCNTENCCIRICTGSCAYNYCPKSSISFQKRMRRKVFILF